MQRQAHDSEREGFIAKAEPGSPAYKERVAEPVMKAVDDLPPAFRALVHEFGYVDVYRAWLRNWTPAMVRDAARGGVFQL